MRALLFALMAATLAQGAPGPRLLGEILARHQEARGSLERLKAIATWRMESRIKDAHLENNLIITYMKRPNMIFMESRIGNTASVLAFDGEVAWGMDNSSNAPYLLGAAETRELRDEVEFDGPLVDYKERGYRVTLVGMEAVHGRKAYRLHVVKAHGKKLDIYLDARTFLEVKTLSTVLYRGREVPSSDEPGDYRPVGGLRVPFYRKFIAPNGSTEFITQRFEYGCPIDDSRFRFPGNAKRPSGEAVRPSPGPGASPGERSGGHRKAEGP